TTSPAGRRTAAPSPPSRAPVPERWRRQKYNSRKMKGGRRAAFFICNGPKQNLAEVSRPAMSARALAPQYRFGKAHQAKHSTARDRMHFRTVLSGTLALLLFSSLPSLAASTDSAGQGSDSGFSFHLPTLGIFGDKKKPEASQIAQQDGAGMTGLE